MSYSPLRKCFLLAAALLALSSPRPAAAVATVTVGAIPGGIVSALDYDPNNSGVAFAGVWGTGIYKTANGGSSWSQIVVPNEDYFLLSQILVSAHTPGLVFFCANKTNNDAGDATVFKSVDDGTTFTRSMDTGGSPGRSCTSLMEGTVGSTTFYAGVITGDLQNNAGVVGGIDKSVDNGATWTPLALSTANAEVSAMVQLPSGRLVAGTRVCAQNGCFYGQTAAGGLFYSDDGGASWTPVPGMTDGVLGLAFNGTNALVAVSADTSTRLNVATSADGASWTFNVAQFSEPSSQFSGNSFNSPLIRYHAASDKFFLIDGGSNNVYRSGGAPGYSWTSPANLTVNLNANYLRTQELTTLAVNPFDGGGSTLLLAELGNSSNSGEGIFKTTNAGAAWTVSNSGIYAPWIDYAAKSPSTGFFYAYTGAGMVYFSSAGFTGGWNKIFRSTGTQQDGIYALALDQAAPQRVLLSLSDNGQGGSGNHSRLMVSPNVVAMTNAGGDPPPYNHAGWLAIAYPDPSQNPIYALLMDGSTIYAGLTPQNNSGTGTTGNYLYKSVDNGVTWRNLTTLTTKAGVYSLAFDPSNHNTVYAGSGDQDGQRSRSPSGGNGLWKSLDAGQTWTQIDHGAAALNTSAVRQIIVSTVSPSNVWVFSDPGGTGGGPNTGDQVWESSTTGANWTETTPSNANGMEFLAYSQSDNVLLMAVQNSNFGEGALMLTPHTCAAACSWPSAFTVYGGVTVVFNGSAGVGSSAGLFEGTNYGARSASPVTGAPTMPTNVSGTSLGVSSITWSWTDISGFALYSVLYGTATDLLDKEFLSPQEPPGTGSFTEVGLSTNTGYSRKVDAYNGFSGVSDSTSTATLAYTLAAAPTSFALVSVNTSSITLSWGANTNPASTTSYKVSYWQATGSTSTLTVLTTTAAVAGLNGGATYYFRLSALNGAGAATPASATLSTTTLPVASATASVGASGGALTFNPPAGAVTVSIPPGAFSSAVDVTLSVPASFPAGGGPAENLTGTGVGFAISLDQAVQPAIGARLSVAYRASDVSGLDQRTLILARYDDAQHVWVPLVSSDDALTRVVTAQTNHFSTFQIMEATASGTVSTAKAFPNPLRPAQGQGFMTFSYLPASARIRIYNLKGVLIKDMTADASGMANWDATNQSGVPVASGVYFVYAQGAGERRTFEVAVQR